MKEKKCKVCSLFDERKFSEEIRFNINQLIKLKEPLEVLCRETKSNLTEYYYKKHRDICLLDFKPPIQEQKIKSEESVNIINDNVIENLNTHSIVEEFRNMSVEEQETARFKLLKEAEYLNLYLVHHQLIYGRIDINKFKGVVPKDDISSLKIITDIILKSVEDENTINLPPVQIIREVYENSKSKE